MECGNEQMVLETGNEWIELHQSWAEHRSIWNDGDWLIGVENRRQISHFWPFVKIREVSEMSESLLPVQLRIKPMIYFWRDCLTNESLGVKKWTGKGDKCDELHLYTPDVAYQSFSALTTRPIPN